MPLLDVFWAMLWFFLFVIWIWTVIAVISDIFRSDQSGFAKAAWLVFVIVLPLLGVLAYLIAQGGKMAERSMRVRRQTESDFQDYIRSVVESNGGATSGPADQIAKLAELRSSGALTETEYQAAKQRILS